MKSGTIRSLLDFVGRVTVVHFVTCFVFGVIFSIALGYQELYARQEVSG